MGNLDKALKSEIARISRREIKTRIDEIARSNTRLRKNVADLKKRVVFLERENKNLLGETKKHQSEDLEKRYKKSRKARLTSKGVRNLRSRLGVTQGDFAKLLGTAPHSVYLWEHKGGVLNVRKKTREALLAIRGLGAKDARSKLRDLEQGHKREALLGSKRRSNA